MQASTLLHFDPNHSLRWTDELHQFKGNLLFADDRVEERNSPGLLADGKSVAVADLALPTEWSGGGASSLSGGLETRMGAFTPPPAASGVASAAPRAFGNPGPATPNSGQSNLTANGTRPSWGTGFAAGASQPATHLSAAGLQLGTSSNNAAAATQSQEPGFSLFPPLFGQEGLLSSKGSGWLLFALALLLLLLTAISMLKRVLGQRQVPRKGSRETLRLF